MRAILAAIMIVAAAPAWANMGPGCFAVTTHKIGDIPAGALVKLGDDATKTVLRWGDGKWNADSATFRLSGLAAWDDKIHKVRKHLVYRDSLIGFNCAG